MIIVILLLLLFAFKNHKWNCSTNIELVSIIILLMSNSIKLVIAEHIFTNSFQKQNNLAFFCGF